MPKWNSSRSNINLTKSEQRKITQFVCKTSDLHRLQKRLELAKSSYLDNTVALDHLTLACDTYRPMVSVGNVFVQLSVEEAVRIVTVKLKKAKKESVLLTIKVRRLTKTLLWLKKDLYRRFGKYIDLEMD